jgi:hypothetical protein
VEAALGMKRRVPFHVLIFATYQNAGVRVFDITDPFTPREVAHFVPPAPEAMVDPRPNRSRVIQSNVNDVLTICNTTADDLSSRN